MFYINASPTLPAKQEIFEIYCDVTMQTELAGMNQMHHAITTTQEILCNFAVPCQSDRTSLQKFNLHHRYYSCTHTGHNMLAAKLRLRNKAFPGKNAILNEKRNSKTKTGE